MQIVHFWYATISSESSAQVRISRFQGHRLKIEVKGAQKSEISSRHPFYDRQVNATAVTASPFQSFRVCNHAGRPWVRTSNFRSAETV